MIFDFFKSKMTLNPFLSVPHQKFKIFLKHTLSVLCTFNIGQQNEEWTCSGIGTLQGNSSGNVGALPGRAEERNARIVKSDGTVFAPAERLK